MSQATRIFYTAEKPATQRRVGVFDWVPCMANSLACAKRIASRRQMFQGTTLFVGEGDPGYAQPVAMRAGDPINMKLHRPWRDLEDGGRDAHR